MYSLLTEILDVLIRVIIESSKKARSQAPVLIFFSNMKISLVPWSTTPTYIFSLSL